MGFKCILLWFFGRVLPSLSVLRQISYRQVSLHLFVSQRLFHSDLMSKAHRYAPSITWAVVLACHGATANFAGITSVRVLLGALESTISPGLSLITGLWYKRSEHASRHGIWFAGNSIASIFGSLLTYGIGHINNGIDPWRVRSGAHHTYLSVTFDERTLTQYSGYSLYSGSSHLHTGLCSTFICPTPLREPGFSRQTRASLSTSVPSRSHTPQFRKSGREVNVSKH
jgi:MFS family permease